MKTKILTHIKNLTNYLKGLNTTDFFLKIALPLIAFILLFNTVLGVLKIPGRIMEQPLRPVSISIYEKNIAGVGVVEPVSETINLGVEISGIVEEILVNPGDKISKNQAIFRINADLTKAKLKAKKAAFESAKIAAENKKTQFRKLEKLISINEFNRDAISQDEFDQKKFSYLQSQKEAKKAEAEMEQAKIELDKTTIKSPIAGEVLKINIRPGEYVTNNPISDETLVKIGDLSQLHLHVEIDESDLSRFNENAEATAILKGNARVKLPLKFVKIEPLITGKSIISGNNSNEKIDVRVAEIIYQIDQENHKILIGQEMDVYIKSND